MVGGHAGDRLGRPVTQLVLFAHGSPDPGWRVPFEQLEADLAGELGPRGARPAYMESALPTLVQVAAEASASGVDRLRVLPLFMASGVHVRRDIEVQAETVRAAHPSLEIEILPPVGEDRRLFAAIRGIALDAADD